LMLSVTSPGTLTVTQARGLPRIPPLAQETDALVVGTTEVLMDVGATVRPAEPLRLAMLEAPAPREALRTPPLLGKTPALRATVARFPRPKVTHALTAAPEHDVERAVIVLPLITVGVARTAGMVTAADATGKDALAPAVTTPPLLGKTPALRATVARFPRPKVTHALTAAPEHDVERAVIVLPLITVGVARTAGMVTAADATGTDADAPTVTRPPDGRTPASRVTVAMLPKPKVMQASTTAAGHDVETAVMVLPEIVRGVAKVAGTVRATDATGKEALTPAEIRPSVGRTLAPRETVPRGPRPRLTQTLRRPLPVHD